MRARPRDGTRPHCVRRRLGSDQRLDSTGDQVDHPDGVVVRIGDIQPARAGRQTGWFVEARVLSVAIFMPGPPRPRNETNLARPWIDPLDPMIVGVGDKEPTLKPGHTEWMLEPSLVPHPELVAKLEEIAPGEGVHAVPWRQLDPANDVGLAVGHEDRSFGTGQAGRLGERAVVKIPVLARLHPGTGQGEDQPPTNVEHPQLMHARHRYEEQPTNRTYVPG